MIARAPGLKRIPLLKLLAVVEIVALARVHASKLSGAERRRLIELARKGKGMTQAERDEAAAIVKKAEPRLFAGLVADSLSPLPLPRRLVRGPKSRRS
jgi:hypothetical protein